ncbi:MAG: hypothetical protein A2161_13010 [Candidatus Schekmanbacteria bacterium RBG_13_48_7]|uniref:Lipopolysaccharide heptosyltransferase I n=1 Tax=Candidatus Schekmanbacteria bacterium RBG_13_48_7 TaxID=1817878 RepID=A0A1F7RK29_9BACT|nr:MAG: hypothetical protein A2161_13010 [Candidatus Schekmanbacteria bacterium RBG_13_48_7]
MENNTIETMDTVHSSPKFAIVKLSSVGDIIHAIPVACTLKKKYKDCHITWISEKLGSQILIENPAIDRVIVVDTKTWRKWLLKPGNYWQLVKDLFNTITDLRDQKFDAVVDLQGLLKSGVISWMLKSDERWGFPSYRCREGINARFSNRYISDSLLHDHIVEQNLAFTFLMGCKSPVTKIDFNVSDNDKLFIDEFLDSLPSNKKKIIVNPGTGWKTKTWAPENYRKLCEILFKKHEFIFILTWGPDEKPLVESIHKGLEIETVITPSTNLTQLAYLLTKSRFVIGGDTGPIHIAAAQDVPVIAVMGPSDPDRNGPYDTAGETIYNPLNCSGCYRRECENPQCINSITVEQVIDAVEKLENCLRSK